MNKLFLLLTTNTAASCSLLFALYPCYSTWFLEFITYSATLSPLFLAFYVCYSTWGFHDFLEEKNLFPHFMHALLLLQKIQSNTKLVSIRLGALLSSLLGTLLDLGLPHAAPMQGESLGTNQADIMAWLASQTTWTGLTLHRCRMQTVYTCPDMTGPETQSWQRDAVGPLSKAVSYIARLNWNARTVLLREGF